MLFMIVFLFCALAALGLGILAGLSDWKGMTIPNAIALLILVTFAVAFGAVALADVDALGTLRSHLLAGGAMFGITFVMYTFKMIGGGDSKLGTAFAFWVGLKGMPVFLFYMAASGALVGVAALVLKKRRPVKNPPEGSWIARAQAGESVVPYGIPITIGAFAAFIALGFFAPDTLRQFLMSN